MAAKAFIEHRLPGRVRLKIPSRRGDVSFFESLIATLSDLLNIDELTANPSTGSVIIRYTGPVETIMSRAADLGLFEIGEPQLQQPKHRSRPTPQGRPDPRSPEIIMTTALALAGLSAYQVSRGEALGSATESFWTALVAYRNLDSAALAALFATLGVYQVLSGKLLGSAASLFFYALIALRTAGLQEDAAPSLQSAEG